MARAREGKEGRPPRFDPVLDEVASKLEKEVFGVHEESFQLKNYVSNSFLGWEVWSGILPDGVAPYDRS